MAPSSPTDPELPVHGDAGQAGPHLTGHLSGRDPDTTLLDWEMQAMRRRYGIIIGAAVTAICALAIPSLLYTQNIGEFGPLPPPVEPPDIVPLTPLETL